MTDGSKPTFEIGIAMSGAISAGAYSAGVFDFLIQALDAWEKAKAEGAPDLPEYDVRLKALSGASAGAITAAIGVIAAGGREAPATFPSPAPRQPEHPLHSRTSLPVLGDPPDAGFPRRLTRPAVAQRPGGRAARHLGFKRQRVDRDWG
ncbi:hypothetical protein [Sinorhizobium fredii]|uniref:hypothetical protein n=1 Tax=Rhizobium fredii TaxID=380 RepID=UPI0035136B90